MAAAKDNDEEQGQKDLLKLQTAIKTNRLLFISALTLMAVVLSILITSVVVINVQMSGRSEVPEQIFAEKLDELESHLQHLIEIHNSEAQVYFSFQDSLVAVKEQYAHEKVNELRRQLADRERDKRKLLQLMSENANNLAAMIPGSREWTGEFSNKIEQAVKQSQQREKAMKQAMAALQDNGDTENKNKKKSSSQPIK